MSNPLASPAAMASHFSGIKRESEGDKDGDQQSSKGESNPSKKLRILPPPLTWEQLPENRAAQEEFENDPDYVVPDFDWNAFAASHQNNGRPELDAARFKRNCGNVSSESFEQLLEIIRSDVECDSPSRTKDGPVPLELKLLVALRVCGGKYLDDEKMERGVTYKMSRRWVPRMIGAILDKKAEAKAAGVRTQILNRMERLKARGFVIENVI